MDKITFEQLPQAVSLLIEKVGQLADKVDEALGKATQQKGRRLLALDDVAALLGKSASTIYAMTSEKRIPYHKRGNKLYFFEDEIIGWIEQGGHREQAARKISTDGLKPCVAARSTSQVHYRQSRNYEERGLDTRHCKA